MPLLVFERGLEAITVTGACCGGYSMVGGLILCIECLKGGEYQYRVLLTILMMMISSKAAASLPRESLLLKTSLVSRSRPDRQGGGLSWQSAGLVDNPLASGIF